MMSASTTLHAIWDQVIHQYRLNREFRNWLEAGRPIPPPDFVKQRTIRACAKQFRLHVFIETGTYLGDMIAAIQDVFDEVYSIELGQQLYEAARRRFTDRPDVAIIHGDSADLLPMVLRRVGRPCLFWLDAHWSGGTTVKGRTNTPIEHELRHILAHPIKGHVILIDDAHCFTGRDDYPTMQELRDLIGSTSVYSNFRVVNNIIAASPEPISAELPVLRKTSSFFAFEALDHVYHATPLLPNLATLVQHHFERHSNEECMRSILDRYMSPCNPERRSGVRIPPISDRDDYEREWGVADYKGKVILDIGADLGSTSDFFLRKGARQVIAVEGSKTLFRALLRNASTIPGIVSIHLYIDNPRQVEKLILRWRPDIVKVDIEGAEDNLFRTKDEVFTRVPEYIVEVHSDRLFSTMMIKCARNNYEVAHVDMWNPPLRIVHVSRKEDGLRDRASS